ncbi:epithelial membrane protein 3-like [Struthio camelus]|uniref:epithelial membrane protein 3-like n=1 Tax=Struthio camelus TaxID=8801 RepID=UPI003603C0D4
MGEGAPPRRPPPGNSSRPIRGRAAAPEPCSQSEASRGSGAHLEAISGAGAGPTRADTGRHGPTRADTGRHGLTRADTRRHAPTRADTGAGRAPPAPAMSFLLYAVTALHVLVLVLLFVATLDKAWWVLPGAESVNLWFDCVRPNGTGAWACASVADSPWLRAVQTLMVGALLLSSAAFALFLWQLHAGPRGGAFCAPGGPSCWPVSAPGRLGPSGGGGAFCAPGGAQLGGGGGAALLYALQGPGLHGSRPPGGRFGHCFALAWLAAPLALASGAAYLRLRKRE